jgi:superfamily II DNA helicase RecQ
MSLRHTSFSSILRDEEFMKDFVAAAIDETHCITQWGKIFRQLYGELGRLRSYFPDDCPIIATTATASPKELREIYDSLHLRPRSTYFRNIGNDRPNVKQDIQILKSPKDYSAVKVILNAYPVDQQWPLTMLFANTIPEVREVCAYLRHEYPDKVEQIDNYHSRRIKCTKRKVMKRFREGTVRILCTTEAAGMVTSFSFISNTYNFNL